MLPEAVLEFDPLLVERFGQSLGARGSVLITTDSTLKQCHSRSNEHISTQILFLNIIAP